MQTTHGATGWICACCIRRNDAGESRKYRCHVPWLMRCPECQGKRPRLAHLAAPFRARANPGPADHDYRPRRLELNRADRTALAPLAFQANSDGTLDALLVPNTGPCYAAVLPPDVAAVLLPALQAAARALLPLVVEDGDPGPLRGLAL